MGYLYRDVSGSPNERRSRAVVGTAETTPEPNARRQFLQLIDSYVSVSQYLTSVFYRILRVLFPTIIVCCDAVTVVKSEKWTMPAVNKREIPSIECQSDAC